MKKAIITLDDEKKKRVLSELTGDILIVCPPSAADLIKDIEADVLFTNDTSKAVLYLNFQAKVNPSITLVILDCLRYNKHNSTIYNKIYRLTDSAEQVIVIDDFPFVFDHRHLYIIMKMLGKTTVHPKQFYDDGFYIEQDGKQVRANALETIYSALYEYIYCDTEMFQYRIHDWTHTEAEEEEYDKYKYRKIFTERKSKMQVVTGCMGRVNRMESKQIALRKLLEKLDGRPVILYNWAPGVKEAYRRFGEKIQPTTYHQEDDSRSENVIFMETIISQKIKFYKKLKEHAGSVIHIFINEQIGADKMVALEIIESLNALNNFYEKAWKNI